MVPSIQWSSFRDAKVSHSLNVHISMVLIGKGTEYREAVGVQMRQHKTNPVCVSGGYIDIKGWSIILGNGLKSCNFSSISHPCSLNASSTLLIIVITPYLLPWQLPLCCDTHPPPTPHLKHRSALQVQSTTSPSGLFYISSENDSQPCPLSLKTLSKTGPLIAS